MLILLLLFCAHLAHASEYIAHFSSHIQIKENSELLVREDITVYVTGETIKHGIRRDFPTRYRSSRKSVETVPFWVHEVLFDGKPVAYTKQSHDNGVRIIIGSRDVLVEPGLHTYTIEYVTEKQIGFFNDHDELYWNVTGNGWELPIKKATAIVALPREIAHSEWRHAAYTGYQGENNHDYTVWLQSPSEIAFTSTKPLLRKQGLTIAVGFPKGIVQDLFFSPSNYRLIMALLPYVKVYAIGFLLILIGCLVASFRRRRMFARGVQEEAKNIDMFSYRPGFLRYVARLGSLDSKACVSEIMRAKSLGLLAIDYTPGTWYGGTYHLKRKHVPSKRIDENTDAFVRSIAIHKEPTPLAKAGAERIKKSMDLLRGHYGKEASGLFDFDKPLIIYVFCVVLAVHCTWWYLYQMHVAAVLYLAVFGCWVPLYCCRHWFLCYTPAGERIMHHIAAVKRLLFAMRMSGQKSAEEATRLYEDYLPYAVALDVEKQWSRNVVKNFGSAEQCCTKTHKHSGFCRCGRAPRLHIASSMRSSIASSLYAPGSRSGLGGRGRSGGGGGGGGGGGW